MGIVNKSFSGVLAVGELGFALMTLSEELSESGATDAPTVSSSLVFSDVERQGVYEWGLSCFGSLPIYAGIYPFEGTACQQDDSIIYRAKICGTEQTP